MLDLGFREDLEFMLGEAPADRRTLMFSATVPPMIATLAQHYQRDAVRVTTLSERSQHADIAYQALQVAQQDAENAIINVLRYHEAQNAHRLRQHPRHGEPPDRALRQPRLPGREPVGRAEPGRAEPRAAGDARRPGAGLRRHRRGGARHRPAEPRTGDPCRAADERREACCTARAGPAAPGARASRRWSCRRRRSKQAERLLKSARVTAEWTTAPGADEILPPRRGAAADRPRLGRRRSPRTRRPSPRGCSRCTAPEAIAAACLRLYRAQAFRARGTRRLPTRAPPAKERAPFGPSAWFALSVGRDDRAEPRWLLPMLCRAGPARQGRHRRDPGAGVRDLRRTRRGERAGLPRGAGRWRQA